MKYILTILLALLLTGCDSRSVDVIIADAALSRLPQGARVIEEIQGVGNVDPINSNIYIIFELKKQCFMMYNGNRRFALVNINCQPVTK